MKKTAPKATVKKLYRSENDRVIAGVCGGLAEYLEIDPVLVRIFFVLAVIFGGFGIIAYFFFWIFIPSISSMKLSSDAYIKKNVAELRTKAESLVDTTRNTSASLSARFFVGALLILFGAITLLDNLGLWHIRFDYIWPLILIAFGISIIAKK